MNKIAAAELSDRVKVGYIGLGAMGWPMAAHLAKAGLLVGVWNRTGDKSETFGREFEVAYPHSPKALAQAVDILMINVSADVDVLAVARAAMPGLRAGSLVIDNSTVGPQTAITLANELADLGVDFVDAPVSGGVEGAKNAALSLMLGGSEQAVARSLPILQLLGNRITHMGGVGQGQATKAVNQIIVAGIAQGVCEALAMAEKLQLPSDKLLSVLTGGAANSWFLEKRGETMLRDEFQSGFKLGLLLKDLNIVASIGKDFGLRQTVVQQSIADYSALVAQGHSDEEISALIRKKRGI
jgi:3-hydroxyisobutyrate dehydrogenase